MANTFVYERGTTPSQEFLRYVATEMGQCPISIRKSCEMGALIVPHEDKLQKIIKVICLRTNCYCDDCKLNEQ